jgi:hypothetical protein
VPSGSPTGSELVYSFSPTIVAGTLATVPYVTTLTIPQYEVQLVQWVVPPGPGGQMGWQLRYDNEIVIPQNGGWIVTDNEKNTWELDELPTGGSWGFAGYNVGVYNHTVYLRFLCNPLASTTDSGDLGVIVAQAFPAAGEPKSGNVLVAVGG